MSDRITVANGKYTVIMYDDGRMEALRHGEKWQESLSSNLIGTLANDLLEARAESTRLTKALEKINKLSANPLTKTMGKERIDLLRGIAKIFDITFKELAEYKEDK